MGEENIIIIDDNRLPFEPGETIQEVALRNNIFIPTLCHLKGAAPTGNCKICVVEVKGAKDLALSCETPAAADMVVYSESNKVIASRRSTLSRLLSSGNHNCAIRDMDTTDWTKFQLNVINYEGTQELCPVWGDCELQDLAFRYQVTAKNMPLAETKYPMEKVNPFIIRDFSRCILCGKCVKACREIQVNNAIDFGYQGEDEKIIAHTDVALKDSDCVFCGECVEACPVGALVLENPVEIDKFAKIKKTRTTCSYCGVGCQIQLHVQNNTVVKVTSAGDVPPNNASLCVKGRFGFDFVGSPDRLTTPLIKKNGKLVKASWDEALDLVASKLSSLKDEYGSDSLAVLTSARISNEENYIAQKFTRAVLKTNNIDHCARL